MHEFSIVDSLIKLIDRQPFDSHEIKSVVVSAGPMRGIDENCLQWAWKETIHDTMLEKATLIFKPLPWVLHCKQCDKKFETEDFGAPCQCGNPNPTLSGGDELTLESLEIFEDQYDNSILNKTD